MDYQYAKAFQSALQDRVDRASMRLRKFPADGPMGLVSDAVKFSPSYRAAKREFDAAFSALRTFNARFTKQFTKEIRADRAKRRAS